MKTNNIPTVWNRGFAPLLDVRREMDRLFEEAWITFPNARATRAREDSWTPACDIDEESNHYLLTLDMPGVQKDQIKLEVVDNQLTISGERNTERKTNSEGVSYTERRHGTFQRTFGLPPGVDLGKVEAHYQDGTLRVYVPKAETAKPRQIKINSGAEAGFLGRLLGQTEKEKAAS